MGPPRGPPGGSGGGGGGGSGPGGREGGSKEARRRNLCPHKWLPGSAVAHLPLIPTPRLTFASSFLCSSCPPLYLLPAASLTLSPPTAHVCTAGIEGRGRPGTLIYF